jgi:hypothetical protein
MAAPIIDPPNLGKDMKTITITTKSKADALHVESLFKPVNGRTLVKERYDKGKYKSEVNLVGRVLDNCPDSVIAVWSEAKRDLHGPYKALYCLSTAS